MLDGGSNIIPKCEDCSVITLWGFCSKLGVMLGHGLENIGLHEEGGLLCTLQSLEEEARASQEEDNTAIKDLKYWEVDCELWVSNS